MSPKKFFIFFDDVNNKCTLKLFQFKDKFLLSFCGSHDLLLSPSAIVFWTEMARTRQKRDIPVQKASTKASVPPGKKYKNAILAEIVREIKDTTLKANNSCGIQWCITLSSAKKTFLGQTIMTSIILGELSYQQTALQWHNRQLLKMMRNETAEVKIMASKKIHSGNASGEWQVCLCMHQVVVKCSQLPRRLMIFLMHFFAWCH